MASILLIISILIPAVFLLLLWRYSFWYRRGIPQGNPLKLFGDMNDIVITFGPHFDQYIATSRRFIGKPFYGVYNTTRPRLIVRDPEMIKEVLTKKFSSFSVNGFELDVNKEPILGRDPFFINGEKWKESRNNFTSLMTPGRLRSMLLQTDAVSKDALVHLKQLKHESGKGDGAEVKKFSLRFMTDLLIRATLSAEAGALKEDSNIFLEAGESMVGQFLSFFAGLVLAFAPKLGPYLGISLLPKTPVITFSNIIKDQKNYRIQNGITRDDVLDFIMKRTEKTMKNESEEDSELEILAMVIMFFLEGFETTTTTISAAIVELARDTDIQKKLRRQILAVCPPGKDINEEVLNIPLLHHCFIESLRMYSPGIILQRVATDDVTLQAKTGEEVSLKKGAYVNISLGAYHRDPEFFPDPDTYNPDRFNDETQKRNFIAFGDGPRQCPGQKFAQMAGKVLLAAILREFKLELSPRTRYPLKPLNVPFMFVLKDIWVRFVPL